MANWRDYLENVLIAVFLALVVRTFVLTGYKVPTSSMAPTLLPGDFIFSYRFPFGLKIPLTDTKIAVQAPERGEIVVLNYAEQPRVNYVKRVIGFPGDRVQIENGELIVNGEKMQYEDMPPDEFAKAIQEFPNSSLSADMFKMVKEKSGDRSHWLLLMKEPNKSQKSHHFGPFIVPPNEVFLLGDNRDSSDDSRYWGTVPIERIEGRVVLIWLSLNWQKRIWENRVPTLRWERMMLSPH